MEINTDRMGRIVARRYLGVLWYAHACRGSVVKKTFIGVGRKLTMDRADRWLIQSLSR